VYKDDALAGTCYLTTRYDVAADDRRDVQQSDTR